MLQLATSSNQQVMARTSQYHLPLFVRVLAIMIGSNLSAVSGQTVLGPSRPVADVQPPLSAPPPVRLARTEIPPPLPAFFQQGPFTVRPSLAYRFVDTTGMRVRPGESADTTIQTLAPGITGTLGLHWAFDYQASWNWYSSRHFDDTLDHAASIAGQTTYEDWSLRFDQSFSRTSQALIETAQQTQEENHRSAGNVVYRINNTFSLETDAYQVLRYTTDFSDTKEWSGMEWLHVRVSQSLDSSFGLGAGYVEVNNGSDALYHEARAGFDYRPGTKLMISGNVGIDRRKTTATKSEYRNTPVLSLEMRYNAAERMLLFARATRSISAAYSSGQFSTTTDFSAGLQQSIYRELRLELSVGYQRLRNQSNDDNLALSRTDNNRWLDARLRAPIAQRVRGSVFYRHSKNSSTLAGYGFASDQQGIDLSYSF